MLPNYCNSLFHTSYFINLISHTGSLTFKDLKNRDHSNNFNASVSVSLKSSKDENIANPKISKYGSSQIDIGLSGHKKEGKTYATIGQGTINISDGSDISSLNRNMTQTEKTTKDINTGGLDVSLTLDHTLLRGDFDKLGKDVTKTIATGAFIGRNTAYVIGASDNDYSGKGASKEIKGSNIFERIWEVSSGAQESQNIQADTTKETAIDVINDAALYSPETLAAAIKIVYGENAVLYSDPDDTSKGFYTHTEEGDKKQIYVNLAHLNITDPQQIINLSAHEDKHADVNMTTEQYHADKEHQESLADAKGFGAASGWELYNVLNENSVGSSNKELTNWRAQNLGSVYVQGNAKVAEDVPIDERQNDELYNQVYDDTVAYGKVGLHLLSETSESLLNVTAYGVQILTGISSERSEQFIQDTNDTVDSMVDAFTHPVQTYEGVKLSLQEYNQEIEQLKSEGKYEEARYREANLEIGVASLVLGGVNAALKVKPALNFTKFSKTGKVIDDVDFLGDGKKVVTNLDNNYSGGKPAIKGNEYHPDSVSERSIKSSNDYGYLTEGEYEGSFKRPTVNHTKLKNIINDMYKGDKSDGIIIGTGSTADAARWELKTGDILKGSDHLNNKAPQLIRRLERWLKNNHGADKSDIYNAQEMLKDLNHAIKGNKNDKK